MRLRPTRVAVLPLLLASSLTLFSQTTGRHHHVTVEESPLIDEAEASIAKNDLATAETKLKKVLEDEDQATSYRAWYDLGYVERGLGKNTEAIANYRKAIELNPDLFEAQLNLGLLLAKTGDAAAAEAALKKATTLKPQSDAENNLARAWLGLAELQQKDRPAEALLSLQEVVKIAPKNGHVYLLMAQIEHSQGKDAAAEQHYRAALDSADPDDRTDALAGLMAILIAQKRSADIEQLLKQALDSAPPGQRPAIAASLGRLLAADGNFDAAAPLLEEAHLANPGNHDVTTDLAAVYAARKDYAKAASLYAGLVTADPQNAGLHYEYGKVLLQLHRFAESQDQFMTTLKLKPQMGDAYTELAMAANENQNHTLVLRALQERAKFLPETPGTYFLRATAYDSLKDFSHASDNYKQFLAASNGKNPDQEWQARHRLKALENMK